MYTFVVIYALFIIGIPALWIWTLRGKSMPKNCVGTRLELHNAQVIRFLKTTVPMWLMMVLFEMNQIILLQPTSHDFRLFWHGFFSGSGLFIIAFMIFNLVEAIWQGRRKREQELQHKEVV